MPELPEVETVRRGLAPAMEGQIFTKVELRRQKLRFDLPKDFAKRLTGIRLNTLDRRGKYLIAHLASDETLIMHLGMSGRFTVNGNDPAAFAHEQSGNTKHDHVVFEMGDPSARSRKPHAQIIFNDPRRFGFMDLSPTPDLETCRHFKQMGPEPFSNGFNETAFAARLKSTRTNLKTALLDQRIVAGIGNIYACEALFRAKLSPRRSAYTAAGVRSARLHHAVIEVLRDAIAAGGSTLKDFANAEGDLGYFQHQFQVYGREGEPCPDCGDAIKRIVQSGRSTFFCSHCQR